jgi:hypothetical protein
VGEGEGPRSRDREGPELVDESLRHGTAAHSPRRRPQVSATHPPAGQAPLMSLGHEERAQTKILG